MKQTNNFKPLPLYKEIFLKKSELQRYYINKRKWQLEHGTCLHWTGVRNLLHPVLYGLIKLSRRFIDRHKLHILYDKRGSANRRLLRKNEQKPVIYAMTHIGLYDIQILCEAIRENVYVSLGDPETMYRTGDGLAMYLNGVVYCDNDDKGGDTVVGKATAIAALSKVINLLIAPEGVWDMSANLLALPLFAGVIDMALTVGCDIIPVGIEQYGKSFAIAFGDRTNVNPDSKVFATHEERKAHICTQKERLRDAMATLKWDIICTQPITARSSLGSFCSEYRDFKDSRYNEWVDKKTKKPYYNDSIVERRTYKQKKEG